MRLVAYIFAFLAFLTMSTAILFKIQHWSGAKMLMGNGFFICGIAAFFVFLHKWLERKKAQNPVEKEVINNDQNILDA